MGKLAAAAAGRGLHDVAGALGGRRLRVATAHLESPCGWNQLYSEPRVAQCEQARAPPAAPAAARRALQLGAVGAGRVRAPPGAPRAPVRAGDALTAAGGPRRWRCWTGPARPIRCSAAT